MSELSYSVKSSKLLELSLCFISTSKSVCEPNTNNLSSEVVKTLLKSYLYIFLKSIANAPLFTCASKKTNSYSKQR